MDQKFPKFVPPTQVAFRPEGSTTLHLRKCKLIVELDGKRKEHTFEHTDISIGSADENILSLTDDTVSRHHCRIFMAGSSYLIQDLNSTNGTFVNQVRIKEAYLKPGCTIEVGNTLVQFQSFDEEVHINPLSDERFGDIIGASRDMRGIFGILAKIAPSDATVVIEGETGTGKEVVANTIHKKSRRADKPFIVFDCSAVPANLIESELFGHEKGSFTGAIMARPGLFELAHGGTVFLDELGELTSDLQPKLLRVLETREVRRVGGARAMKVDVRVIAATNRSLEEEVRAGRFREDLFYRLSVVRLNLPPLRERREDIQLLARHFLNTGRFNRSADGQRLVQNIGRDVMEALRGYDWPGNVRELVNVMERAVSFAETDAITLADLPANIVQSDHMQRLQTLGARITNQGKQTVDEMGSFKHAKEKWVSSFERDYIVRLLEKHGYNISHAARDAEIDRKYFRKLMKKYGIENPRNADSGDGDD